MAPRGETGSLQIDLFYKMESSYVDPDQHCYRSSFRQFSVTSSSALRIRCR